MTNLSTSFAQDSTSSASHYCHLCGSQISLAATNHRGEGWKAVVQELRHHQPPEPGVSQALVSTTFYSQHLSEDEARVVHAACWGVVTKLWGKTAFTIAELDSFLDCAGNVAPFLPEIPFPESPEHLDITIDHQLDAGDLLSSDSFILLNDSLQHWKSFQGGLKEEGIVIPSLIGISKHKLPPQIDSFVAYTLQNATKVRKSSDPSSQFWAGVIGMLANSPAVQFRDGDRDRPSRIAQAMKNLRLGGISRFPHTANFDVVRANALTILMTLIPIHVEELPVADTKKGKRAKLQRPRLLPLTSIKPQTPFRLNFYTLRRQSFLGRNNDRGFELGMKYLRTIEFDASRATDADLIPTIGSFCGVRLIRDEIGVWAVHAKDGSDWFQVWQQDTAFLPAPGMAAKVTTAEWPAATAPGSLMIVADTNKDLAVFHQSS